MRIVLLADLHFISAQDPAQEMVQQRQQFACSPRLFRELAGKINAATPDLIVGLGDLVDWHSPENLDHALEMMAELKAPWQVVPGNHEFSMVEQTAEGWRFVDDYAALYRLNPPASQPADGWRAAPNPRFAAIRAMWSARGVAFHNRTIESGDTSLWLLDSALSEVLPGTAEWLAGARRRQGGTKLLLTHVPPDSPKNRSVIITREPYRDLNKYVQSKSPRLYVEHVRHVFSHVFSGHLHNAYTIPDGRTTCHILGQWGCTILDVGAKGVVVSNP